MTFALNISRSISGQPWRWRGAGADARDPAYLPDDLVTQLLLARGCAREALEACRETLGDRHPRTLAAMNNLGTLLMNKGDLAAAEPLCREALKGMRETLGDRHPTTLSCIRNLGALLQGAGQGQG